MEPTIVKISMVGNLFYSFSISIAYIIGAIGIFLAAYTFHNNARMKLYNKTLKAYHKYNSKIFELINLLNEDENFDLNNIRYKAIMQELLLLVSAIAPIFDKDVQLKINQLFINAFMHLHTGKTIENNIYESKEIYLTKIFELQTIMKNYLDRIKPFKSY